MTTTLTQAKVLTAVEKRGLLMDALRKKARHQLTTAPLSYGQKALWFLHRSAPESAAYHVSFSARIRSALDVAALRRACQALTDRHAMLRAVFKLRDGEPVQEIPGHRDVCFMETETNGMSAQELHRRVMGAYQRPFDLENESAFRVNLFTCAKNDHVLLITVHHIVYDAWSLWLNLEELGQLYAAEVRGVSSPLAFSEHTYCDYIQRQGEMLAGAEGERLWNFWKNELGGNLSTLNLPTDRPRPPVQSYQGASYRFKLDAELAQGIRKLAQSEGVTPFMTLLAAYQVLMHRYTGQDDILVGSPTTGRGDPRFAGVAGYFVNPVVLRANLGGNPPFKSLLQRVFQTALNALGHQDFPFPLLVERLQPKRDPSYAPLFQVSFVYQKPQRSGTSTDWLGWSEGGVRAPWGGLEIEYYDVPQQEGQFDLELEALEAEGSMRCLFKYNTDIFDETTIERMARHFSSLLAGIVADPLTPVDRLPLLDAAERTLILEDWNATAVEYPQGAWVHQLFERQAESTPSVPAVIFGNETLSYAQLNERANRLAHYLQAEGVGRDSVVGVCLERSIDMVVALHAIVKAGGAYLPLDPEYPSDRLDYMASDGGISLLLTHARLTSEWKPSTAKIVTLDTEWPRIIDGYPATNPQTSIAPDDIAYVIYTSGSTGKPKGVAVPHRGLLNRLQWMQAQYRLSDADRVLQKTPYSFDVSVWEFFWPFMTGAALVVAPPGDHRDSRRLVELIREHGITTLHFVPSMLRAFLDDTEAASCTSLRQVVCSGEALPYDLQQRFFAAFPAELHNLYGPTEASIDVSHWTCRRDSTETVVPIGFPIANTSLYVLDAAQNPVPIGVAGELHIGGVGLARGYLNKPELTAEKFIPDPFSRVPGARMYKTGDLACFRTDGAIEYLGRLDHQVKIRGFRIELGEIETVLGLHPDVNASVVVAHEDRAGKRLVAYVVSRTQAEIPSASLRQFLGQTLPDHMVPSTFITLDSLPLSSNGKIDRRALPAPESVLGASAAVFVPPRDAIEQKLAQMWQAVLNVGPIGVHDNFFERGGHSLLAVSLMARIERDLGRRLPLATLFRSPTVEALGEVLREQGQAAPASPLVPIQTAGTAAPLFCVAGGGGSVLYYYPLANYLGADQPFYGLQAIGLDGECEPIARVEDLAAIYVAEIQSVQPKGPYLLGGHCFGGLVAFEIAQQLRRKGEQVTRLLIMDVPARRAQGDAAADTIDQATWMVKLAGVIKESSGQDLGLDADDLRLLAAEAQLERFRDRMQAAGFLPPGAGVAQVRGLLQVFAANSSARYTPQDVLPVPITLFRAGDHHADYDFTPADDPGLAIEQSTMGWNAYAQGEVPVRVVPGNHITMMSEPNVAVLAQALTPFLAPLQTAGKVVRAASHLMTEGDPAATAHDASTLPTSAKERTEVAAPAI